MHNRRAARPFGSPSRSPFLLLIITICSFALVIGYGLYSVTAIPFDLMIGGTRTALRTHQPTVREALSEAGIALEGPDRVSPALDSAMRAGLLVSVEKARPILVFADGKQRRLLTLQTETAAILAEAEIILNKGDRVERDGATLTINRAQTVRLDDGGAARTLTSTAREVGAVLAENGIALFAADRVTPPLDSSLPTAIRIERSLPIQIDLDGRLIVTRTLGKTVAEALAEQNIALVGEDYALPTLPTAISAALRIQVVRVAISEIMTVRELPFKQLRNPDPALELDQIVVVQTGIAGVEQSTARARYESGVEVSRSAPLSWVARLPQDELARVGTLVAVKSVDTPDGALQYWRTFKAAAESYKPSSNGKTPADQTFGVTSTGQRLARGIIAADAAYIPVGTQVYIPGYGRAVAGDILPGVAGLMVRLGYGEDDYQPFAGEVTLYLLPPALPADLILPLPENR